MPVVKTVRSWKRPKRMPSWGAKTLLDTACEPPRLDDTDEAGSPGSRAGDRRVTLG